MASGRMLNKKISLNRAVNELSCDSSRLAFTWTIPHLDRDGRIHGEPDVLKAIIFPRRQDISTEEMRGYIAEWAERKLVIWYELEGDQYLQFPAFADNQIGMRYERESKSNIPPVDEGRLIDCATEETVRSDAGASPEASRSKSAVTAAQWKGIERKRKEIPLRGVKAATRKLYHAIESAFLSKSEDQDFAFAREGPHIISLEKKCGARPSPEEFTSQIIEVFWDLVSGDDPWWLKKPFLPSILDSAGIWPMVLKEWELRVKDAEIDEEIERVFP